MADTVIANRPTIGAPPARTRTLRVPRQGDFDFAVPTRLPLPSGPAEITAGWLSAMLHRAGMLWSPVKDVLWQKVGARLGLSGIVARVEPRYEQIDPRTPATLIAKFSDPRRAAEASYRNGDDSYTTRCAREVYFYKELAPLAEFPVPAVYYAEAERSRVMLLMEDLAPARSGDALRGCGSREAELVVETMARYHARWWRDASLDKLAWLARPCANHEAAAQRYSRNAEQFVARYEERLPRHIRSLVLELRSTYADVLARLAAAPATLIHGDLQLDNVIFSNAGKRPRVWLIDWQTVSQGPAVLDLAQLISGSLKTTARLQNERDLLGLYYAGLIDGGVRSYPFAALLRDYRLSLLCQLAGVVNWLGAADVERMAGREQALADAVFEDQRLFTTLLDHEVANLI